MLFHKSPAVQIFISYCTDMEEYCHALPSP